MRSSQRCPVSLREPCVTLRSMTAKRIARSAKWFVGSMPGVVMNRRMTSAFEISDQGGEPRPDPPGPACGGVDGRVVDLLALAAPASLRAKLDDGDRFAGRRQFDLPQDLGRQFAGHDRPV